MLLGHEIDKEVKNKKIYIHPYIPSNIGPNSYDVTLDSKLLVYDMDNCGGVLDCKKPNKLKNITIPEEGYILQPGILYLGSTVEYAGSDNYVPMYDGRSSKARLGIGSHISAGFGDIGFKGKWTLEITVIHPTVVYPNMRIGQVYFMRVDQNALAIAKHKKLLYNGKYSDQSSATGSLSYIDFI